MLNKKFNLHVFVVSLLVGIAVAVFLIVNNVNSVFAAPKGVTTLKLFQDVNTLDVEPSVNNWLATQSNIVIDSIDVDSAGAYQIAIGYHAAGSAGAVTTRLKLFEPEEGGVQDAEDAVNAFLSSLSSARNVRALDVSQGTVRPIAVFILYD